MHIKGWCWRTGVHSRVLASLEHNSKGRSSEMLWSSLENPGLFTGFLFRNEMGLLYWGLCILR